MNPIDNAIDRAAAILSRCRSLLALTGAGISSESGVPTYRGPGGIYEDSAAPPGMLTADCLLDDPDRVWRNVDSLRVLLSGVRPNRAHEILAEWESEEVFGRFLIATQNVDALHRKAGSRRVTELHGNIWEFARPRERDYTEDDGFSDEMQAFESPEGREELLEKWSRENDRIVWENREVPLASIPPCDDIGVRPNILLFDEGYGNRLLRVHDFLKQGCDAVLVVGCSGGVLVLDHLLRLARRHSPECALINVNPHLDCLAGDRFHGGHIYIEASAVEGLEALDGALRFLSTCRLA